MNNTQGNLYNEAQGLEGTGGKIIRYGLVIVFLWIGMLKFTTYEAEAIKPLVENSPLLSWIYNLMSVQGFSKFLGVTEIVIAILIASRPFSPKASALGSIGAIIIFLTTLTFLFSTPGVWQPEYGFPYLSPMPGQFIAKDLIFLGAAIWTAGEALNASRFAASKSNRTHVE